MGFGDAGAHLRNMAFYNYPIRLLKRVHDTGFMKVEHAVYRLTGELAQWYGIDAGHLRLGDRADLVIVDPSGLNASVDGVYEAPIEQFGGISRMVNRNDDAVDTTVIAGKVVYRRGRFIAGKDGSKTGRFLRAGAYSRDIDSTEQLIRSAL